MTDKQIAALQKRKAKLFYKEFIKNKEVETREEVEPGKFVFIFKDGQRFTCSGHVTTEWGIYI